MYRPKYVAVIVKLYLMTIRCHCVRRTSTSADSVVSFSGAVRWRTVSQSSHLRMPPKLCLASYRSLKMAGSTGRVGVCGQMISTFSGGLPNSAVASSSSPNMGSTKAPIESVKSRCPGMVSSRRIRRPRLKCTAAVAGTSSHRFAYFISIAQQSSDMSTLMMVKFRARVATTASCDRLASADDFDVPYTTASCCEPIATASLKIKISDVAVCGIKSPQNLNCRSC